MAVKKYIFIILFLFVHQAKAAQVISQNCINEVLTALDNNYRVTYNASNGNIYLWERHIKLIGSWSTPEHHCYLYFINPGAGSISVLPLSSVVNSLDIHMVMNLSNSILFWTNGIGLNQSELDWCTQ